MGPQTSATTNDGQSVAAAPAMTQGLADDGNLDRQREKSALLGLFTRARPSVKRVRNADVVVFMRHLAILLAAGLQISKALKTVVLQLGKSPFASVVQKISLHVESGVMLSSAMALHPEAFDTLTVNVVRAGEAGGTMSETLGELADEMERSRALRRTVVGAMAYPAIVMGIAALIVCFLLLFVVPTFEDVYRKMHVELPLITRVVLGVSRALMAYWWVAAIAGGAIFVAQKSLKQCQPFQHWKDSLILKLPFLGKLRRKAIAARFLSSLATLVSSGVSIVDALGLMTNLVENSVVKDALKQVRTHVTRGGRMSEPMQEHAELFSPMAVQMVSVGEETGSLAEAAKRTAEFLSEDVHLHVQTMTKMFEPMMTVGLGIVVGLIALAIYLPMFDLMKHVSK